jgi:hypothetical protein
MVWKRWTNFWVIRFVNSMLFHTLFYHSIHSCVVIAISTSFLQIHEINKETVVDKVFKKAVQEFHSSLISTYSVMMKVNPVVK